MFVSTMSKSLPAMRDRRRRVVALLAFVFSKSFGLLFFARAIQGIGSACSSVSGERMGQRSL